MPAKPVISHAFVLPDRDFYDWLAVLRAYRKRFEGVIVIRSPGGSDLNRFRDVTAIQAPLTWMGDSALKHIRRVYPRVVLVDVIAVTTPAQLGPILAQRVKNNDRYGERETGEQHIFRRFALEWMTGARPMRVLDGYNDKASAGPTRESLDIHSEAGADLLCPADGEIIAVVGEGKVKGYRAHLRIESQVEGERFITTCEGIKQVRVKAGDLVRTGQILAKAQGERLRVILQNPPDNGASFKGLKNLVNPRDYITIPQFVARPIVDNLRVRRVPSRRGKILGNVFSWDLLEPLEHHGRAMEKLGAEDKWIKLRSIRGLTGYSAAKYLRATTIAEAGDAIPGVNPVGVNLDAHHPMGKPRPAQLGGIGWVRLGYNVSNYSGSEDIHAALQRYLPLVDAYREAGYRVIFAISHQTYGEAKSQFWPWSQMTDNKWRRLSARLADMMANIAAQWAGRDIVHAWQIWNEQDASHNAVASVPMSSANYAMMFARLSRAIRSRDSDARIITGGFNSGPQRGKAYARRFLRALPSDVEPDGIAFHPYGRGLNDQPKYAIFGHIDESVWAYSALMPDKPLWMTEFGVLDRPNDSVASVAKYATDMVRHLKVNYPGKFAALIWYAWAEGMHNGYGLVDRRGNPRPPLTEGFLSA